MIRFRCPHCRRAPEVSDGLAGKRFVCSRCGTPGRVPDPHTAPAGPKADPPGAIRAAPPRPMPAAPAWSWARGRRVAVGLVIVGVLAVIALLIARLSGGDG